MRVAGGAVVGDEGGIGGVEGDIIRLSFGAVGTLQASHRGPNLN